MAERRLVAAWCAGAPAEVALRPSPADHRRVRCPSCGARRTEECVEIGPGHKLWKGHASRQALADRTYGGENPP